MTQPALARLTGAVHHLCFVTVAGERMLVAARNRGLELIETDSNQVARVIAPHQTADAIIALPRPGLDDLLLAGGADGTICGYEPSTGEVVLRRRIGDGSVKDLAILPDAATVAATLDSGLHLWTPGTDTLTRLPDPADLDPSRQFKLCTYAHADRQWVVCAYTDGHLAVWAADAPTAAPVARRAHDGPIWSLVGTADDSGEPIVISGGSDRRMKVWRPQGGEPTLVPGESFLADGTIRRLGHVTDGQTTMLVTASATGSVALWRLDGSPDRPEAEIFLHSGEAWALACADTADGVLIASGDMNGSIKIRRLSTALIDEDTVAILFQTGTTIWAVAHGDTVDGPYLACAGVDQTVNVIDPTRVRRPLALHAHSSTVRALATGGDRGRPHVISGGADHRVFDWDPHRGELRGELRMGHQGEVWALATFVENDLSYVVSGSADGSVRLMQLDIDHDTAPRTLAADCGEVNTVLVVPADDDTLIVVGSTRGLRALSVRHGTSRTLSLPAVSTACGVLDTGRYLVVTARQDGVVQLIDPIAGATVSTFTTEHEAGQVRALSTVDIDGTTFVLGGCDDGRVVSWHIDGSLVGNPARAGTAGIRSMQVVTIARTSDPLGAATAAERARGSSAAELASGAAAAGDRSTQSAVLSAGHDGSLRLWPVTVDPPLRSGGSIGRSVRPASILLQDQPTDRDHLSRNPLVETLYDALTSPNTTPPVVVGVHAPWGQGKSSLLRQLRSRVDPWTDDFEADHPAADQEPTHHLLVAPTAEADRRWWRRTRGETAVRTRLTRAWAWRQVQRSGDHNAPLAYEMHPRDGARRTISVWFNPWMYERTDQIWAGLTREILIAVTERLAKEERERLWFDLNLRRTDPSAMRKRIVASYIPRTLFGLIVGAALLLTVAIAIVSMAVAAVNNPTIDGLLGPTALIMLTVLGTIAQLTGGSFKHIHGWVAPDELNSTAGPEHAWKGTADPLTSTDRGYLYMLQHDVGEVVSLATKHGPLYVFIDDLDRCGPDIVADTVEAINLFLNKAFGQCIFVIALDPATVAAHLETSFQGINERAKEDPTSFGHLRHTGWRFMEKIIDLPIRLPRLADTALSEYLDRLLDTGADAVHRRPPRAPAAAIPRQSGLRQSRASLDAADSLPPTASPAAARPRRRTAARPVEVVIVPDEPSTAASVAAIEELEALRPVRDALRAAVLSLPGRNPRQTKAFVNLWRFYMVLDHRTGRFSPSLLAIERHSVETARLVELMVRWPYLLDLLGEPAAGGSATGTTNLDRLIEACAPELDDAWTAAALLARLDPADRATHGLRDLLQRALPNRQVFTSIARRYL